MELNSLTFVLIYMPIFIMSLFLIKNNKYRSIIILVFSLTFYLLNSKAYILLLFGEIFITYLFGKRVAKNRTTYFSYLVIVIGILCFFKYKNGIIFPLGLSFYTFTSISYVSDVYREKIQSENNLFELVLYLSFFPTITSGPILRYDSFKNYINNKNINIDSIAEGFRRFIIGLFKKVVIANQLSLAVNTCFDKNVQLSTILAWFGAICFMLQLYYDFSGYSDMAIGICKMIGYTVEENFNDPYISKSIKEFWRRWHISLSTWFKDYVYIPLGGSRVDFVRWIINILIVWSLTGIWHGSTINYLFWGLWNALLLILEKVFFEKRNINKWLRFLGTQLCVMFGFVIFRAGDLSFLVRYIKALFGFGSTFSLFYIKRLDILYLWFYILIAIMFIIPKIKENFYKLKRYCFFDLILLIMLFISISFIISGSYSNFIYAEF